MSADQSTIRARADDREITASLAPTGGQPVLPRIGDVIDRRYRLDGILGTGGMGIVFEATHLDLGERVALKVVNLEAGQSGERLRREARIALRITGEHAVRTMDVGTLPSGAPYVVMERLAGRDLAQVLRERGPLPVEDAVDYVLQACVAMVEAHRLDIVHRDLKPSNLFLAERADGSPRVVVLDFGIAKTGVLTSAEGAPLESLTLSTAILGSPQYMAPEQVRGAKGVDRRADVWALGVILHELCAGAAPFSGNGPSAVLAAIAADPPVRLRAVRPDAPEALEAAVARCLEKDPERRTPHVGALAVEIAPFAPPRSRVAIDRIAGIAAPPAAARSEVAAFASEPAVSLSLAAPPSSPRRWLGYAVVAVAAGVAVVVAALQGAPPRPVAGAALTESPADRRPDMPAPPPPSPAPPVRLEPWAAEASPLQPASPAPGASSTASATAPVTSSAPAALPARRRQVKRPPAQTPAAAGVDLEAATAERH